MDELSILSSRLGAPKEWIAVPFCLLQSVQMRFCSQRMLFWIGYEMSSQRLMVKGLIPQLLLMPRDAWVVRMLISSTAKPCNSSQLPGRWGLVRGSGALGHVSEGCVLSLDHLLLSASCLPSDLQLSTMAFCCDSLLSLISTEPTINQKF